MLHRFCQLLTLLLVVVSFLLGRFECSSWHMYHTFSLACLPSRWHVGTFRWLDGCKTNQKLSISPPSNVNTSLHHEEFRDRLRCRYGIADFVAEDARIVDNLLSFSVSRYFVHCRCRMPGWHYSKETRERRLQRQEGWRQGVRKLKLYFSGSQKMNDEWETIHAADKSASPPDNTVSVYSIASSTPRQFLQGLTTDLMA